MKKIITVASNKGGATKTTAVANMAYYLATKAATLAIDFDSQGQLALWFGKDPASNVFDWWTGTKIFENSVTAAREVGQLWLLLGDTRTKTIEKLYRSLSQERFDAFVQMVRGLTGHFEYVILDTAPAGILQEVAVAAADEIVVPFLCETAGVDGAFGTWAMLKEMKVHANVTFLPSNFFDRQTEANRCLLEVSKYVGGERIAPKAVVHRAAVAEALSEGCTVWENTYLRIEPVRDAYQALCHQLCGPFAEDFIVTEELIHEDHQH